MVDRRIVSLFYILKEMNLWSQNFRLSDKERESQLWDVVYRRGFSYLFINNRYSFLFPLSVNYLGKKVGKKAIGQISVSSDKERSQTLVFFT